MLWGNALPAKYYQPVCHLVYTRPLLCWNESAHSRNIIVNDFCIAFDRVISTHVYKAWVLSLFMTGFQQQVKVGRKKWTVCRQTPAFLSTQWAGLKAHTDTEESTVWLFVCASSPGACFWIRHLYWAYSWHDRNTGRTEWV